MQDESNDKKHWDPEAERGRWKHFAESERERIHRLAESSQGRWDVHVFTGRRGGRLIAPKLIFAICLILAGTVLFLDNIGLLHVYNLWDYWPLIFIALGVSKLLCRSGLLGRFWGLVMIAGGSVILACNLGLLHMSAGLVWSLLLIIFGTSVLLQAVVRDPTKYSVGLPSGSATLPGNVLREWAVFGGVKRRVNTPNFEGGELLSILGGIDIDLRHAQIPPGKQVTIEANSTFGGIDIKVPETWRVVVQGAGIFGGYEDKTIPPRPVEGVEPPTLIVIGQAVFGGVTVEN